MVSKRLKKDFLWLIIGILLFLFLRLPSLFEPFTYGDEGIYLTLGLAIKKGLTLYKEIHDNKPPLIYLLSALTGSFSYYRAFLFLWSLLTIFVFYRLNQIIFKNKKIQIFNTFLFLFLSSIHTFEGNIGNAENFMLLPIIAGFYFYLKAKKPKDYFLSGLFFALGGLFKIPAVFDFLALIFFSFLLLIDAKKKNLKPFLILITGFITPFLITFFYFATQNALVDYLKAAFFQNIPYLASWAPDKATKVVLSSGFFYSFINRSLTLVLCLGLIFYYRKKISLSLKLILSWFLFSLFAAFLSARPYPHYLLQVIPSFSLSAGLILEKGFKKKIVFPFLSLVFLFFFVYFKFWHYPNLSYYLNFYQYLLGQKTKEEYFSYFGNHTLSLYQVAEYLQSRTSPEEKIFIWGNEPSIYALSQRLPVGKYTVAYHILDFQGQKETLEKLAQTPPSFIVVSSPPINGFPEFFTFLSLHYQKIKTIGPYLLYRLFSPL
ncbi:MAG: ArnT family glycosyltransferase [Microgenomates group bacterium]